ncbi:MAG: hypothetical protein ACP5KN_10530 [Armatimonadota bacterium]
MMGPHGRMMMGPHMMGPMSESQSREIPGGTVWMAYRPTPPTAGQVHFMVFVDDETGHRDFDATVSAYLCPQESVDAGRGVQVIPMGGGHAMGYVDVEEPGEYELAVRVQRPDREDATVYFPMQIQQAPEGQQYGMGPGGRMGPRYGQQMGPGMMGPRGGMRGGQWMMGPMSQMMERSIPQGEVAMAYRPAPLTPGQAMFSFFVSDLSGRRDPSATLTAFLYPQGNPEAGRSLQMAAMGGGHAMGTTTVPSAGSYELAVRVKRPNVDDALAYFPLQVHEQ